MNNLEFTKEDLRAFFEENKDRSVGKPCDDYACPITQYFLNKRDCDVRVQTNRILAREMPGNPRNLEPWQSRFVNRLDVTFKNRGTVTGQEAISILDEIIQDEQTYPYRHSLLFDSEYNAEEAQSKITDNFDVYDLDIWPDDGNTTVYEVRFYTATKMTETDCAGIVSITDPDSYGFNAKEP